MGGKQMDSPNVEVRIYKCLTVVVILFINFNHIKRCVQGWQGRKHLFC